MIRRYMLFAGDPYDQEGGMHDFVKSFDTPGEAEAFFRDTYDEPGDVAISDPYHWWHVYDTVEQQCVRGETPLNNYVPDIPTLEQS